MLTRAENGWNFSFLKFYSDWNFLPISVDEKSGRISIQEKKKKLYLWYFFYGLEILHLAYGTIRGAQLVLSPNINQMIDQLFFHSFIFSFWLTKFWNYQLFIKRPRETVMVFNQLFNHNNQTENNAQPRKIWTWPLTYNRHELITLSLPFVSTGAALFGFVVFLSDPDRMWILNSLIPAESKYKHWSIFLLLTAVDAFFLSSYSISTFIFCVLNQFLFFQKCDATFSSFQQNQIFRNSIEMPRARCVENLLKEMRIHFVYIHLFNRVYAYIIFTMKQLALCVAIFAAVFAIRYNIEYPLTSIFAAYMHLVAMFNYSLMYERAFTIPENWRKVKSGLRVSAILSTIKKYPDAGKAGQFQKEIQRIPELGVKVGDFHEMERESTPNFIMFVVSNVAGLLITFR